MFDLNLVESTVTILYVKFPIADMFMYAGALIGLYKNYSANMHIYEKQFEAMEMTKEEKKEAIKVARYKYIRDNAKTHYMNIRRIVKKSSNTIDDKALLYLENFSKTLTRVFGDPPDEEEKKLMKLKAREIHQEVKLIESSKRK